MVQLLRHNSKKRDLCRVINSAYYQGRSQSEKAGNVLIMQSKGREAISCNGVEMLLLILICDTTFLAPTLQSRASKQSTTSTM